MAASDHETVFTLEATPIKFGPGAADDAGWELKRLGVKRAMLVTDPGVASARPPGPDQGESSSARASRSSSTTGPAWSRRSSPSRTRADFALEAKVDGFVSVGGGSSIDTAKVVEPHHDPPGAGHGLRQPAGRRRAASRRRRCGRTSRSRRPRAPAREATTVAVLDIPEQKRQERHLAPLPAPDAGHRRPRARPHAARRGDVARPGSTSSATPPSPTSRAPTTAASGPRRPTTARPTRARTRSPTCGRRRRSSTAGGSCAARSPTPTTSRPAA